MGPFERDAMAGLPGFDASTLVCAGDAAGSSEGQWSPAADVPELAPLALAHGAAWAPDAPASSFDLLDKLQIESAGLIGDDQYPSAAEVLFQDAEIKKSFAELLVSRTRTDDTEVRRLRGLVSELSVQLELMYRRIAQLENTHADFLGKLSRSDAAVRPTEAPTPAVPAAASSVVAATTSTPAAASFPTFAPRPTPAAKQAAVPAPEPETAPEIQAAEPQVAAFAAMPQPLDPPKNEDLSAVATAEEISGVSARANVEAAPSPVAPIPDIPVLKTAAESVPASPLETLQPPLPEMPMAAPENSSVESALAPLPPLPFLETAAPPPLEVPAPVQVAEISNAQPSAPELPTVPVPESASEPSPEPTPASTRRMVFDKPKTLRIVPTMRTLRVVGPAEAGQARVDPEPQASVPAVSVVPAPSVALSVPEPSPLPPMPDLSVVAPPEPAPMPAPEATLPPLPTPTAFVPAPPAPSPAFESVPAAATSAPPSAAFPPPGAFPAAAFPSSGSIPAALSASAPSLPAADADIPPSTAVFSGAPAFGSAVEAHDAPRTQEVLARLAKPAAAPPTAPAPKPRGGGKTFMILGGVLVVVLILLGVAFLRHSRDLKQMAALDDGKPLVGAEPVDEASRMALPKPSAAVAGAVPGATAPVASPPSTVAAVPGASGASTAPVVPTAPGVSGLPPAGAGRPSPVAPEAAPPAAEALAAAPAPGPGDAAVAFVKDFPLDGGRGTVEKWLQFSYAATPDAGREVWNGVEQSDGSVLVEYRFIPNVPDAPKILYLFAADPARGYVQGKNRDARDMLSGGGPRTFANNSRRVKSRKSTKKKSRLPSAFHRAVSSASAGAEPETAQLPLPSDGELPAPAEPDGDFGSDTVKAAP